ncbi:hypothetical protein FACS1894102_4890 [Spirochaetia bacterium]|nr:hypothetical protein FACS1894102_4890 [Spirochaetia bacterium]
MAGGQGTRLWPYSNSKTPKQFLTIPHLDKHSLPAGGNTIDNNKCGDNKNSETFFTSALTRALSVTNNKSHIIIIANKKYSSLIENECAKIDTAVRARIIFIPEPVAKNTAAAIAMAAVFCKKTQQNNPTNLVLTSDHIIMNTNTFALQALDLIEHIKEKSLAVFGIKPSSGETGFGYIEVDFWGGYCPPSSKDGDLHRSREQPGGCKSPSFPLPPARITKVISFHEKPDADTANKYLQEGNYFWNSGMFAFSTDFILDQFKLYSPDVLSPFEKLSSPCKSDFQIENGLKILQKWDGLERAYNDTKSISFDYAVAEKCKDVIMLQACFDWRDVGSWDEYAAVYDESKNSGTIKGSGGDGGDNALDKTITQDDVCESVFSIDAKNNFIVSDIPVACIGVDDLVVYIRGGKDAAAPVALIAKKGQAQDVRDIVQQIKDAGREDLL